VQQRRLARSRRAHDGDQLATREDIAPVLERSVEPVVDHDSTIAANALDVIGGRPPK